MDDLVTIDELEHDELETIFERTDRIRDDPEEASDLLSDRTLLMLFEKPSTRTRISFETGMTQLGGHAINFDRQQSQMSRGETLKDTAKVVSRYCDGVMARLYDHGKMEKLREHADIPVINGLTDRFHPCQAISDMYTLSEKGFSFEDLRIAYLGDGNNVCHSLMQACGKLGIDMTISSPEEHRPETDVMERASSDAADRGADMTIVNDPRVAVRGADVIYTDVWVSMGDENPEAKKDSLRPYQVNEDIVRRAKEDVKVMHCLPAHRGEEVTSNVMDGDHSIVYDQAENRLHVQKAILDLLIRD